MGMTTWCLPPEIGLPRSLGVLALRPPILLGLVLMKAYDSLDGPVRVKLFPTFPFFVMCALNNPNLYVFMSNIL
jgi:hypothetical protein